MAKKDKILIIEDEKPIAKALTLKLKKEGLESQVAANGQEALDLLDKEKYGLLILDLVMPKMDGFDFLEEIKKKNIDIPIIVSSNLSQDDDIKKAKELGASDFLVKSDTSIADVVQKVKDMLEK
ncbi:MAG TPA: response regulator [Patescibacteria group bacterium]|nr:response regulator [Patescibacteria group bacterium]